MKHLFALVLLCACSTGRPLNDNWNFNFWSFDAPEEWTLVRGQVSKAPTWNTLDFGMDLSAASDIALYQDIAAPQPCMRVKLISDIAEDATVRFRTDIGADGSSEQDQEIPRAQWALASLSISAPADAKMMRIWIEKRGSGHAVVANLRIETATSCEVTP